MNHRRMVQIPRAVATQINREGKGVEGAEEEESVVVERASVEVVKRLGRAKKANVEAVKRANVGAAANKLCRPKLG